LKTLGLQDEGAESHLLSLEHLIISPICDIIYTQVALVSLAYTPEREKLNRIYFKEVMEQASLLFGKKKVFTGK